VETFIIVLVFAGVIFLMFNMFRNRSKRMKAAAQESRAAAAQGLSISRDLFEAEMGHRAPVEEFHVVGNEARVTFGVPLGESDDEILNDLLADEAIEVLRDRRHTLPIEDVDTDDAANQTSLAISASGEIGAAYFTWHNYTDGSMCPEGDPPGPQFHWELRYAHGQPGAMAVEVVDTPFFVVETRGLTLRYDGDTAIDGVAGTAAAIRLNFLDAWGSVTGSVFPTGGRTDWIDGLEVTCIDAAMPLVILRAADLGLSGRESPDELDANRTLLARIEEIRLAAGQRMGLGDVSGSVVPKPVIVSAGDDAHSITSRYFTPHACHKSHAVTGALALGTAAVLPGTIANRYLEPRGFSGGVLAIEHPSGRIEVDLVTDCSGAVPVVERASFVRTARRIFEGHVYVPAALFE